MQNLNLLQTFILSALVVLSVFGAGALLWIFSDKKERAILVALMLIIPLMMAHFYVINP